MTIRAGHIPHLAVHPCVEPLEVGVQMRRGPGRGEAYEVETKLTGLVFDQPGGERSIYQVDSGIEIIIL